MDERVRGLRVDILCDTVGECEGLQAKHAVDSELRISIGQICHQRDFRLYGTLGYRRSRRGGIKYDSYTDGMCSDVV